MQTVDWIRENCSTDQQKQSYNFYFLYHLQISTQTTSLVDLIFTFFFNIKKRTKISLSNLILFFFYEYIEQENLSTDVSHEKRIMCYLIPTLKFRLMNWLKLVNFQWSVQLKLTQIRLPSFPTVSLFWSQVEFKPIVTSNPHSVNRQNERGPARFRIAAVERCRSLTTAFDGKLILCDQPSLDVRTFAFLLLTRCEDVLFSVTGRDGVEDAHYLDFIRVNDHLWSERQWKHIRPLVWRLKVAFVKPISNEPIFVFVTCRDVDFIASVDQLAS